MTDSIDACLRIAAAFENAAAIETIGRSGQRLPIGSAKLAATALRKYAAYLIAAQLPDVAELERYMRLQKAAQRKAIETGEPVDDGLGTKWYPPGKDGVLIASPSNGEYHD